MTDKLELLNEQSRSLRCRKCQTPYHYHLRRTWLQRNLFFFLPLKRYFCAKCVRPRIAWVPRPGRGQRERVLISSHRPIPSKPISSHWII